MSIDIYSIKDLSQKFNLIYYFYLYLAYITTLLFQNIHITVCYFGYVNEDYQMFDLFTYIYGIVIFFPFVDEIVVVFSRK